MEETEVKTTGILGRFVWNHPILSVLTFLLVFGEIMDFIKNLTIGRK